MSEQENQIQENQAPAAPAEAPKRRLFKTKEERRQAQKQKSLARNIVEWILTILAALVIAFFVRGMVFEPVRVDGESMHDTLADGEIMFVDKTSYASIWFAWPFSDNAAKENCPKWTLFGDPQRFDVVICHYPNRGDTNFVKRVVGLPGDTIKIYEGYLYVNGEKIEEPYINDSYRAPGPSNGWYFPETVVPEGKYFVMGDHRTNSNDSRALGPIDRSYIVGRVSQVLYPFNAWRSIPAGDSWQ